MGMEPLMRVLMAALLAVPIGLERELRGKAAGLRTHVVVATASAALGHVSLLSASGTGDGTRIAAQVVSGIGFLGAGVIFASGGRVHGLTTAAGLWSAAAVGLCAGLGQLPLAAALVFVTLLFLWPVDRLRQRTVGGWVREERVLRVLVPDIATLAQVQRLLTEESLPAFEFDVEPFGDGVSARLTLLLRRDQMADLVQRMRALDAVAVLTEQASPSD